MFYYKDNANKGYCFGVQSNDNSLTSITKSEYEDLLFYYTDSNNIPLSFNHSIDIALYSGLTSITKQQYIDMTFIPTPTDNDYKNMLRESIKSKLRETDWVFRIDNFYYIDKEVRLDVMNYCKNLRKLLQDSSNLTYNQMVSAMPVEPEIPKLTINSTDLVEDDILDVSLAEHNEALNSILTSAIKTNGTL